MQRFSYAALGSTLVLATALLVVGCSPIQGERRESLSEQVVVESVQADDSTATDVSHASNEAPPQAIPEYLSSEGGPTTFSAACEQSGILASIKDLGPFTVLAPTDEAFAVLGKSRVDELMDPANEQDLARLVSCHIIPGRWTLEELRRMSSVPTIGGWYVPVSKNGEEVFLGSVKLSEPSLESENLIVYTVETVFDPENLTTR